MRFCWKLYAWFGVLPANKNGLLQYFRPTGFFPDKCTSVQHLSASKENPVKNIWVHKIPIQIRLSPNPHTNPAQFRFRKSTNRMKCLHPSIPARLLHHVRRRSTHKVYRYRGIRLMGHRIMVQISLLVQHFPSHKLYYWIIKICQIMVRSAFSFWRTKPRNP